MNAELRLAMVGLDTSHAVEFTRRLQAPDCPPDLRVAGARVVSCVRFVTPFQDAAGLDLRQAQLEAWGVAVGTDLDAALGLDVDAILIEINDPTLHLENVRRCAALKKPIFLDKPLAADLAEDGRSPPSPQTMGCPCARRRRCASCRCCRRPASRYRSRARRLPGRPRSCARRQLHRVVWRARGGDAAACPGPRRPRGERAPGQRRGGPGGGVWARRHGGGGAVRGRRLRGVLRAARGRTRRRRCRSWSTCVPATAILLRAVVPFLAGGPAPVPLTDTLEVMAILDAADRACRSGRTEPTCT